MKTIGFSYYLGFAAREHKREPKPVAFEKAALSRFFDTLKAAAKQRPKNNKLYSFSLFYQPQELRHCVPQRHVARLRGKRVRLRCRFLWIIRLRIGFRYRSRIGL